MAQLPRQASGPPATGVTQKTSLARSVGTEDRGHKRERNVVSLIFQKIFRDQGKIVGKAEFGWIFLLSFVVAPCFQVFSHL